MREIKFRAWVPSQAKMVLVSFIGMRGGVFEYKTKKHGPQRVDGAIPLQYTGLKDKNGRDIYEGDIVKAFESWDDDPERWVVEYGEGHYDSGYYKFQGFFLTPVNYDGLDEEHTRLFGDAIVIGNIYENPELMK